MVPSHVSIRHSQRIISTDVVVLVVVVVVGLGGCCPGLRSIAWGRPPNHELKAKAQVASWEQARGQDRARYDSAPLSTQEGNRLRSLFAHTSSLAVDSSSRMRSSG